MHNYRLSEYPLQLLCSHPPLPPRPAPDRQRVGAHPPVLLRGSRDAPYRCVCVRVCVCGGRREATMRTITATAHTEQQLREPVEQTHIQLYIMLLLSA